MPGRVAMIMLREGRAVVYWERKGMAVSEPELPRVPPAARPPKSPLANRIRALFSRIKIPGWLLFLYSILVSIADWNGRIEFWINTVIAAGGYVAMATLIISSPLFTLGIAGAGVLWLLFVGEPNKGVLRDPRLVYVGWGLVSIVTVVIGIAVINGYVEVRAREIAEQRDNAVISDLREQLMISNLQTTQIRKELDTQKAARRPWRLTEEEKVTLASRLNLAPKGKIIVSYNFFDSTGASAFAEDIKQILKELGYSVSDYSGKVLGYSMPGLWLIVKDKQQPPPHAKAIQAAFISLGINMPAAVDQSNELEIDEVKIAISSRPTD